MQRFRASVIALLAVVMTAMPLRAAPVPVDQEIPVALLVDLSNGQILYSREADRRFVPASITKVMTAFTAFELVKSGELALDKPVLYSRALEREWYGEGSTMFLRAGETPTVAQLLLGITTVSGNDASIALAIDAKGSMDAWLTQMNANAAKLDMANTHFGTPNGYPDDGQTYTTANDLALLGRAITMEHSPFYRRFFGHRELSWGDFTQQNHDPVTGQIAGADGIKTGFTNEAGFTFLGSAQRDGRRLIMVLAGAPTQRARDEASRAFLEWGFANFAPEKLASANVVVGEALVQDGAALSVPLVAGEDIFVALPGDIATDELRFTISYRGPVSAPIAAGQRVAVLHIHHDSEELMQTPLLARDAVEKAGLFQRISNAMKRWLG